MNAEQSQELKTCWVWFGNDGRQKKEDVEQGARPGAESLGEVHFDKGP